MEQGIHGEVAKRLAGVSQRYTRGRRDLVEVLLNSDRPLTTREILGKKRSLNQSSVYRNLAALEEASVVRRLAGGDEFARYELAENLTEHHHHLVCTKCGRVFDFSLPPALEKSIANTERSIARSMGFRTDSHNLDFLGLCRNCAE
jgi:Fe2+ or Zn2+ uptake regulation protein